MQKVTYFCDNCKEECESGSEPVMTFRECCKTDAAGSRSTYVNSVHLCGTCARRFLSKILCGTITELEDLRKQFDRKTSV